MVQKIVRKTFKRKPQTKKRVIYTALKKAKVNYIKSIAKSVLKKKTETKFAMPFNQNNLSVGPYDTTANTFGTEISLISPFIMITQGTSQGERIGNRIDVTSLVMKGYLCLNRTVSPTTSQNVFVKLVFMRRKNNLLPISSVAPTNFFQNGATTQPPANTPTDIMKQINRDAYIVYTSRLFKLGFSDGGAAALAPNNDFKLCKMFRVSLSKHISKIHYDDNGTNPTNWACYCVALMCNADGTSLTPATAPSIDINFDLEIKYKDY